ncbi:hypothetical protein K435DRAFT_265252 [Dendrothele bispora CBS 962.96]|uniref:Heterokaryon incompatibility domain-containing protein n=1 Tax=Dendrothele bispora (strain CBS 962.96) TaxID=1314807 RepID=A0A4S8MX69_DENBC|nr:hypothetical protein K435DRAFT_265252 [Dendrothele bispora CBS 962.96]
MLSLLCPSPPLISQRNSYFFKDCIWLGATHDGYPRVPLDEYTKSRRGHGRADIDIVSEAALSQALFTFGFLESVMEIKIPENVLLRTRDDGTRVMTCENLPHLLQTWRSRIRSLKHQDIQRCYEWADRVDKITGQMYKLLMLHVMHPTCYSPIFICHRQSQLSFPDIAAIFNVIASIAYGVTVSRRIFPKMPPSTTDWTFMLDLDKSVENDLVKNGWCPSLMRIFSGSVCLLGYVATCQPFTRDWMPGHAECTRSVCIIHNIDPSNYVNRHVTATCNCTYAKPALEKIMDLLGTGDIPVIETCDSDLLGTSNGMRTPYVAISHVWSDGLGSTSEVGLPTCQISHLARLARHLITNGSFWIDALCVPKQSDMRKKAIGLMAETYRRANVVLIIDAGIRSCALSASPEEKLLRIITSAWMQRLWTLQEGLFASKLVFEFSDGLAPLEDLLPRTEEELTGSPLLVELALELHRMRKHIQPPHSITLGDAAQSLRWRTSSRLADETLAISGLLNVNPVDLYDLSPQQRMRKFLIQIRNLPPDIIFMQGPKLEERGFRWAPATMMTGHQIAMSASAEEHTAICTSDGLFSEYAAVYFPDIVMQQQLEWFVRDQRHSRRIYKITDMSEESSGNAKYTCNTLLLRRLPGSSEVKSCVAVLVLPESSTQCADGTTRFMCEYRRRLLLTVLAEDEVGKINDIKSVIQGNSGHMQVLIS